MSTPTLMSNTGCRRLGSRFLLCLISFFVGCTFAVNFISTTECSKSSHRVISSTENSKDLKREAAKKVLVAVILSAPDNVIKRHALRRTWLSLTNQETTKYYFVLGSKGIVGKEEEMLLTEERHYSDMLILPDVEEGYDVLTKKLLSSFTWLTKNLEFDFLLKVDDDSFVDVRTLIRELTRKEDNKKLYWGYFNGRAKIQLRGKWQEENWNLCDRYLPYARGGGYIISKQLVHYIAQNAMLLNVYKNEDVSVGAWLAPLNITRIHDVRFDTEWASRGCSNDYLITHPHDVAAVYKLHEDLTDSGRLCKLEFQKRPAYNYDWNVLPSQCCKNLVVKTG